MLNYLDFPKGISLIYGVSASGKTTLCSQLVANNSGKIVFIDTENGFNVERVQEMNPLVDLNNIMLFNPTRYSEQFKIVKNLDKVKNISLVIIDSFTHFYRKKLHEKVVINPATIRMLKMLQDLEVPVILTSQVYSYDGKVSPVGSDLFRRFVSYKIFLELDKNMNTRKLIIKDEKIEVPYIIDDKGLTV